MRLTWFAVVSIFVLSLGLSARAADSPSTFSIGDKDFLLDGQPHLIRCGEMHFARIPREYWAHRLRMAHAMGLNTVCAYLFWNIQEPAPGKFDFTGNADAAEFCRLAQKEGLQVILRPGPYSCAEWDFGGLPWWLLKIPDIKVRTQDPRYLEACKRYLTAVGKELGPLQITHGGPIIMVQVENEYGSFGKDKDYIGIVRDDLKAAGFDVPLFTCDGPSQLTNDVRNDIFCAVNFGKDPEKNFQALRGVRTNGPLICSEYYPGWFDSWSEPHHTGTIEHIVSEMTWMLEHDASFSIYMVHGGTTFGFDAGANCPPFVPEITSYDYDAPISEAGWATPKYYALRDLFSKHLNPGEQLPEPAQANPVVEFPPIVLSECAALRDNLPEPKNSAQPQPMEMYDQAHGAALYRTELPAGPAGWLHVNQLHDYGLIFLDGQKLATLDRRHKENSTWLPARKKSAQLDILIDTFGHVTYGHEIYDPKGITEKAEWIAGGVTNELSGWSVFNLPFDDQELSGLKFHKGFSHDPAFYRGSFSLEQAGDTFLDVSSWGKGMVWVNGHNLGRFWNLGPQQTLYCPGPWLKAGANEIIVLEMNGARQPVIAGVKTPVLDQVN
jgi:beta-galactosidase